MRVLIYQNPSAGHEITGPETLVGRLQQAGHEVEWRSTKEHRLDDATNGSFDLIVAAGGDGSVGRTARQLVGYHLPIAVLPLGTANNLASILDAGTHDLADRIAAWSIVPFDAGIAAWADERDWFFEGVGIGAFAETAARLTAEDKAGPGMSSREVELARDITALRDQAGDQPAFAAEIEIDGARVSERLILLEVLNIGMLGPNVELAAGVDPSDGALDVILVEERQRAALVDYLSALAKGQTAAPPFTGTRARQVRVTLSTGACAHIDGRTVDLSSPVDLQVSVQPHAVKFLGGTS